MQTYSGCYLCILNQSQNALDLMGTDETTRLLITRQIAGILRDFDPAYSPSNLIYATNQMLCTIAGNADPYQGMREAGMAQALAVLPRLERLVADADDPLDVAIRLSIAGNIIDVIPGQTYDLWKVVEQSLKEPYTGEGLEAFRHALGSAKQVLYLADNAGESVFDRLLIEQINQPVVYAVKSGPILNDTTQADAVRAGIDHVARIVCNGSYGPGTILEKCSEEFLDLYQAADLIISKGQANYETLSEEGERVFFLMKVKCPVIGHHLGAPVGSHLLQQGKARTRLGLATAI